MIALESDGIAFGGLRLFDSVPFRLRRITRPLSGPVLA